MVFLHMLAFQQICKLYETQLTLSNTREKSAFPIKFQNVFLDFTQCYTVIQVLITV